VIESRTLVWKSRSLFVRYMFKGFDYFMPGLIATVVMVGIFFAASLVLIVIPMFVLMALTVGSGSPELGIFFMLLMCVLMFVFGVFAACVHALIVFTHLLIVDRKMDGLEAVKLSAKASWQNINGVVGFIIVQFVLSILGLLAFIVGAYLVLPIIYAGTTVMYRKIFPPMFIPPISNIPPSPANYPNAGYQQ